MDDSGPYSVTLRRMLPAPPARVFEAWRDPRIMARWFAAPGWIAEVSSEFRVGGGYRIQMRDDGGRGHRHHTQAVITMP